MAFQVVREWKLSSCRLMNVLFFLSVERVEQFKVRIVPCTGLPLCCLVALLQVLQVIFVRVMGDPGMLSFL